MKKYHKHACSLGDIQHNKRYHQTDRKVSSKTLAAVYNKYYKAQVEALYRAVQSGN
ncbi:MAG: hypothetical protein ABH883_07665 [Candidatus Omnitrophota bacterium]